MLISPEINMWNKRHSNAIKVIEIEKRKAEAGKFFSWNDLMLHYIKFQEQPEWRALLCRQVQLAYGRQSVETGKYTKCLWQCVYVQFESIISLPSTPKQQWNPLFFCHRPPAAAGFSHNNDFPETAFGRASDSLWMKMQLVDVEAIFIQSET